MPVIPCTQQTETEGMPLGDQPGKLEPVSEILKLGARAIAQW